MSVWYGGCGCRGLSMRSVRGGGNCASRKSLFLRSQCQHTLSQYSYCHRARHTFRLQLLIALRLTHVSHPSYEHSALSSSLTPPVHQRYIASAKVTELPCPSFSSVCMLQAWHLARHRFNILFAFHPLSHYPLSYSHPLNCHMEFDHLL